MSWSIADIPDQSGRRALVTGATDGLGLQTALALAGKGARVVLSGRNAAKGAAALARILQAHPGALVSFEAAELGDLASVRALAARVGVEPLDLLVNNAGILGVDPREATADGFERQLAVNYLSHFTLTGGLLDALRAGAAPRVVNLSSLAHRMGRIQFDDLQLVRGYTPMRAYARSKLAMLMFAGELQRRSDAHGWGLLSLAAHPGGALTNMLVTPPGPDGRATLRGRLSERMVTPFVNSAAQGALPTLFAATSPEATPAGYYGPDGFLEIKGAPARARSSRTAGDPAAAARLWEMSQALTGAPFGQGV